MCVYLDVYVKETSHADVNPNVIHCQCLFHCPEAFRYYGTKLLLADRDLLPQADVPAAQAWG